MLPFKYALSTKEEILSDIAQKHNVSVEDLRCWNPTTLKDAFGDTAVSLARHGAYLQLPPLLHVRGSVYGNSFSVASYCEKLNAIRAAEETLLNEGVESSGNDDAAEVTAASFQMPTRRQATVRDAVRELMARTAIGAGAAGAQETLESLSLSDLISRVAQSLEFTSVANDLRRIEDENYLCGRVSCARENAAIMAMPTLLQKENHLSEDRVYTTRDAASRPIDRHHDAVLSITFLEQRSLHVVREVWSVLASQPIGVLIDAMRCKTTLLPYQHTKNAFFFIGGCFYIDDRHADFCDLSAEIRAWDPVRAIMTAENGQLGSTIPEGVRQLAQRAYGASPVRRVSETTFADLTIRLNEMCVYRHCATCDHMFYFSRVDPVPPFNALSSEFPRRTFMAPDRIVFCDVCAKLPASIATYGDRIAPYNPALFCVPCFRIGHCHPDGTEVNDGYVKVELPEGEFF